MSKLLRALRAFVKGLRRRTAPAAPGFYSSGKQFSSDGFVAVAPLAPWTRDYLLYVPRGYDAARSWPLVVWLHGCKQTPEDFAFGTRIAMLADEAGFFALLPRQTRAANFDRCWNWFDVRTGAGHGEAAIVLAQVDKVMRDFAVDRARVYLAGMSSGGALAAAIAVRHPQIFSAVAIHSGLACGAATGLASAQRALQYGAQGDVIGPAAAARASADMYGANVPALVIQGAADTRVNPINAAQLVRQFLALNGDRRAVEGAAEELPTCDRSERHNPDGVLASTAFDYLEAQQRLVRYVAIEGLAHAWSGGDDGRAFNDPRGPDATRMIWTHFAQHVKPAVTAVS